MGLKNKTSNLNCHQFLLQFFEEHTSVSESRARQSEPIDLDTCLRAFTMEEELGEEDLFFCSKCKKHCLASKKLHIWRLPPILVRLHTRLRYFEIRNFPTVQILFKCDFLTFARS